MKQKRPLKLHPARPLPRCAYTKNEAGNWGYTLTMAISFYLPKLALPPLRARSLKGEPLAEVEGDWLSILPGYAWDGCTGVGRLVESSVTLRASLLHDFLYQLGEQSSYAAPYTRRAADLEFRRHLPCWAKLPYYTGVRALGGIFWRRECDDLRVQELNATERI